MPLSVLELFNEIKLKTGSAQIANWIVSEAVAKPYFQALSEGLTPDDDSVSKALNCARRLEEGEPIQYVLGRWSFRDLELIVDPRALIPRPETEVVVEVALRCLTKRGVDHPRILELGTGSGAPAIALATEIEGAYVLATDLSVESLSLARANLGLYTDRISGQMELIRADWFRAIDPDEQPLIDHGEFDLIFSNPPYISQNDYDRLEPLVRDWEPRSALVSGERGTEQLETILSLAPRYLAQRGFVVLEMDPAQIGSVVDFARGIGYECEVFHDLAERERGLVAKLLRDDHRRIGDSLTTL
ncbi:MAG: peptide chain release factor N(5)-glutamine methyltransferase [Acidimicrobiaceae bacterium]|nr:peptide chain release factor N(5)-glutamine methyltransferase [Acidimicrobiaceae bacterium]